MAARLDAHAHFFYPGFIQRLPENCRRVSPDEITLYQAYAQQYDIAGVLAIGYEGAPWAAGNNAYLATLAAQHPWLRPTAFVTDPTELTVEQLVTWQKERFVGISLYIFTPEGAAALSHVPPEIWRWLGDHAWLISVNSTGDHWQSWQRVLTSQPDLCLLIAHLGIPPAVTSAPTIEEAQATMKPVLELASYPYTYVKFSGFYALAKPGYEYPHRAAWPYAEAVTRAFGTARILWASDFSPALEYVSFAQTVAVLEAMPWLTGSDLQAIYHDNLARLLATIDERNPNP